MTVSRRDFLIGLPFAASAWGSEPDVAASTFADQLIARARALRTAKETTLNLLAPNGCEDNLAPIIAAFTRATDISIQLELVGVDDINTRLTLGSILGRRIDVALPASFGIPDLVEAGALQPIGRFKNSLEAQPDPVSLYTFSDNYAGKCYGYQTDGDVYLMFYNRRLLEDTMLSTQFMQRYGRKPAPAETWQELDQMIRFYHRPDQNLYGGSLFRNPNYLAWEFWMRMHAKGQLPFSDTMQPLIDSPKAIDAAAELAAVTPYLTKTAQTDGLTENWRVFGYGRSLCNLGWGGSQKHFRASGSRVRDAVIAAPIPRDASAPEQPNVSHFNWGWNFTVPSTALNAELSYLFARFAVLPEPSLHAVRAPLGFFDPHQASHYADPEVQKIYGTDFLSLHQKSLRAAIPDLYLRGRNLYFADLNAALQQVDLGRISPADGMRQVASQWENHTRTLGREDQAKQWQRLLQHYPDWLQAS